MWPTPITIANDKTYDPAEDSFFLLDSLEADREYLNTYKAPVVLEIGSGSGIVITFLHSLGPKGSYYATDLNAAALKTTLDTWSRNNKDSKDSLDAIRGSLVPMRKNVVDILVFNPPYVPTEVVPERPADDADPKWLDLALDGGEDGMQVTNILLNDLENVLSPNGAAYILFCASNKPQKVMESMKAKGWTVKDLGTRRAGWEVLSVYRFTKNRNGDSSDI